MIIRNSIFQEEVRAADLRAEAITFIGCTFRKGLNAREANIGKSLKLINCEINQIDGPGNIAFDLAGVSLGHDLFLYNCRIGGRILASGLNAKGNVRLRGCRIARTLTEIGDCIRLDEISIDNVDALLVTHGWKPSNARFLDPAIEPALSLDGAVIGGDLEITAASVERQPVSNATEALVAGADTAAAASIISGHIDAGGIVAHGRVSLFGTLCRGNVDFRRSHCHQDVTMYCHEIGEQGGYSHFRTRGRLDFSDAIIESSFNSYQAKVDEQLNLTNAKIGGDACLDGIRISGNIPGAQRLLIHSAHIAGSLSLQRAQVEGDVSLYRITVGGNVFVLGLRSYNLDCAFATAAGLWAFPEVILDGEPMRPRIDSELGLKVRGDLTLSGANIQMVELRGISVQGIIKIKTGKFGRFCLAPGVESSAEEKDKFQPRPCRAAAVLMSAIEVDETLDVSGLQLWMPGGWYSEPYVKHHQDKGFMLVGSHIGRDLRFFTPDQHRALELRIKWLEAIKDKLMFQQALEKPQISVHFPWSNQRPVGVLVWGGLDLKANRIDGEIDLRDAQVGGPIYLNNTIIGLDLLMGGWSEQVDENGTLVETPVKTTCSHLDAEKLHCSADMDLTGLRVEKAKSPHETASLQEHKRGAVSARGAEVKGEILFLSREEHKRQGPEMRQGAGNDESRAKEVAGPQPGFAWIEGNLDLTAVCTSHLLLTGKNLSNSHSEDGKDQGLRLRASLERGRFGRLEIVDPPPDPINLSKITVDRWVFGHEEPATADDYNKVLEKMDTVDRSTWIDVERALRNQGQDRDANRVYQKMRLMARAKSRGGLSRLWLPLDRLYGLVLGYGTRAWVFMIPALIFFLLNWLIIFSQPQYIRASTELIEALGQKPHEIVGATENRNAEPPVADKAPIAVLETERKQNSAIPTHVPADSDTRAIELTPNDLHYEWAWTDALALTLRYQVPIIPGLTHSRWEAGGAMLYSTRLTVEQYAFWLAIYHWIAWPLFLIWLTTRVVRGRQN